MIICVTGKAGSGKTTVSKLLKKKIRRSKIIDADKIGISLLSDKRVKKKLVSIFGKKISTKGKIDRKKLARMSFSSHTLLKKLNSVSHPLIIKKIQESIGRKKTNIIDAALYHELKLNRLSDFTILVKISDAEARTRLEERIYKRRKFQRELKKADFIIYNNDSIGELNSKIKGLISYNLLETKTFQGLKNE